MEYTDHSRIRAQQRGISQLILDLLIQFGAREPAGDGADTVYFDKQARKRISAYTGGLIGKLSGELDVYAIVSGDKVITTGHRYKRINRT